MIVVEGADNAGKSTLITAIRELHPFSRWTLQQSEGPPKYPGEMTQRVTRYLAQGPDIIYDRHPCVSQPIYGLMRSHHDAIPPELIAQFYASKPLFIYCDGRGMRGHVFNPEHDTALHLDAVNENYERLLSEYRQWAGQYAFMCYRIGDPVLPLVAVLQYLETSSIGRV
jgi:hypothetical protein